MSHTHTRTRNAGFGRKLAAALAIGVAGGAMSLALVAPPHAQETAASLRGQITGAEGISQVVAIEVDTGIRRTATVDAGGLYTFAALRPGSYRLEVTTADGVRLTDEFTLLVAQDAVLDFDLSVAQTAPADATAAAPAGGEIVVEEQIFRGGLHKKPSLLDYKLPTSLDTPELEAIIVETNDSEETDKAPVRSRRISGSGMERSSRGLRSNGYESVYALHQRL